MGEKRVLDEETRKKLYGYVPFSTDATVNFTPEEFNAISDVTLRPIFQVRSFAQAELTQTRINYRSYNPDGKAEENEAIVEKNRVILCGCISGWSNYFDSGTGEEIEYNEENKKKLPDWIVIRIADFIKKISTINAPENLSLKS